MAGNQDMDDLVEKLPLDQLSAVRRYLHFLCAEPDDEPYTGRQRAEDAEATASIARGEGISHEEILREFRS